MRAMKLSDFKAKCLAVVDEVARTGEPILVLKRGKPVARLVPAANDVVHPQDALHGTVEVVGDIVSPVLPSTVWEATADAPRAKPPHRRRRRA